MSENFAQIEQCPACSGRARLMLDLEDETKPQTDQWGYPQYYCLRCGNIFAVGEKFVPAPPQSVLEDAARQLLTDQPDMGAVDLASRLRMTPREAHKLKRKIRGENSHE